MTVEELIEELKQLDPKRIVVMSSDGEGNNHSPLSDLHLCAYRPDSTYSGEIGPEKMTPELKEQGYTDEDIIDDGQPAVCLYPVN